MAQKCKIGEPTFIQTCQSNSINYVKHKSCGYSSMTPSLSIKTELKHSSIIARGALYFSTGLLLNCSSCYKFYYSLSKKKEAS